MGNTTAFVLAISHKEGERIVLDFVKEWEAPFDPTVVVEEAAAVMGTYRTSVAFGDAYAAQWVVSSFKAHGITYKSAEMSRSEGYLQILPRLLGRNVMLLDHSRMISQFANLQRKTGSQGRDSIDHPKGARAYDDVCNAATISLVKAQELRGGGGVDGHRREMPKVHLGYANLKKNHSRPAAHRRPTSTSAPTHTRDPGRKVAFAADGTSRDEID